MGEIQKSEILPEGEGIICPSCGRFVGAYERCPHCQAIVHKRLSIIFIKRLSVIGTIVGIFLMWVAALQREVPLQKIGEIKIQNNMALVRCVGKVTLLKFDEDKNNFTIKVDDDTGMLTVSGFDKLKKFRAYFKDTFPAEGDLVEVVGNLSISEKFGESMFISDPRRLKVLKKYQAETATIENINLDSRGAVFRVRAKIAATRKYKIGTNITVKDDTGSMDLNVFDTDLEKIADPKIREQITGVGNEFEISVLVDEYKGKPQLRLHHPERAESIKKLADGAPPLGEPPASVSGTRPKKEPAIPSVKAIEIREDRLKEIVTVSGKVDRFKEFQFGTSVDLTDESGTVNVWLKENLRKNIQPGLIKEGASLQVTGEVSKFKDRLQILPKSENEVTALADAGNPPAPPLPEPAASVSESLAPASATGASGN